MAAAAAATIVISNPIGVVIHRTVSIVIGTPILNQLQIYSRTSDIYENILIVSNLREEVK